jgi:hypothetical protein
MGWCAERRTEGRLPPAVLMKYPRLVRHGSLEGRARSRSAALFANNSTSQTPYSDRLRMTSAYTGAADPSSSVSCMLLCRFSPKQGHMCVAGGCVCRFDRKQGQLCVTAQCLCQFSQKQGQVCVAAHSRSQGICSLVALHLAQVPDADACRSCCCHVVAVLTEAEAAEGGATACKGWMGEGVGGTRYSWMWINNVCV